MYIFATHQNNPTIMKKILNIVSSQGGGNSFSVRLSDAIIDKLQSAYPGSTIHTRDLAKKPFPHLEESHITSFFTPEEYRTEENKTAIRHSDQAVKEVMDSDIIVIGTPMYNFSIPSNLKSWIDHIVRQGITFTFTETGSEGLVKDKKVYLSIATGGIYSEGPMKNYDFTESYLRTILGFIGLIDVSVIRVEGTAIPEVKETALQKAIDSIQI